jgi:hypothetical protein
MSERTKGKRKREGQRKRKTNWKVEGKKKHSQRGRERIEQTEKGSQLEPAGRFSQR